MNEEETKQTLRESRVLKLFLRDHTYLDQLPPYLYLLNFLLLLWGHLCGYIKAPLLGAILVLSFFGAVAITSFLDVEKMWEERMKMWNKENEL